MNVFSYTFEECNLRNFRTFLSVKVHSSFALGHPESREQAQENSKIFLEDNRFTRENFTRETETLKHTSPQR